MQEIKIGGFTIEVTLKESVSRDEDEDDLEYLEIFFKHSSVSYKARVVVPQDLEDIGL